MTDSVLPVVCTCHRQRCWTRLDGDKTRQNRQARWCQWISACWRPGDIPSTRLRVDLHAHRRYQPFKVQVSAAILGVVLMADFSQGLDASKLILAETVRFSNSCYVCSSPQLSLTRTYTLSCSPSSSAHTLPLRTTFPSFSLVYMCKRAKKQPPAYSKW